LRRAAVAAALGVLCALVLGPGVASAACPTLPTSPAFAQFGDEALYTLAPGGSFEGGGLGWSLRRAKVVPGNESFDIVPGGHSLMLEPGGSGVSPWMCISSEFPSFRFVARQLSGEPGARLSVDIRWLNLLGITVDNRVAALSGNSEWTPTPSLQYGNSVPLWLPGGSGAVQLAFQPSSAGTWAIDDVLIDPYKR
jgi:hypothetical protein